MFNIPCINITKKNTTSKPLLNIHHFLAGNLRHKSDLYIQKSGDIFVQYLQQIIVIILKFCSMVLLSGIVHL